MGVRFKEDKCDEEFDYEYLRRYRAEHFDDCIRVAPLVVILGDRSDGQIYVGQVLVVVKADNSVEYHMRVYASWRFASTTDIVRDEHLDRAALERYILEKTGILFEYAGAGSEDQQYLAAQHAKYLCEVSRNDGVRIRTTRYAVEEKLALKSTESTGDGEYTKVVSSMIMLNLVCSRVSDVSERAIREGLYSYLTDVEAYHSYRFRRDPSLIVSQGRAELTTTSWMRLHDTAIRQCEALSDEMRRESSTIAALLSAASSISSSRDAEAQSRMNLLVGLVTIGIGVPAVVLALYGAQVLLPLKTWRQQMAFVPVGLALITAGAFAIKLAPKAGRTRWVWISAGIMVIIVLIAMILGSSVVVEKTLVN